MDGDTANLSVLSIKEARGIMIYLSTKIKNSICRYKSQFNWGPRVSSQQTVNIPDVAGFCLGGYYMSWLLTARVGSGQRAPVVF